MRDERPWYREPETFIALAALVVSVSAVVVGLYEASLQRAHDRAEVWPHVELAAVVSQSGAVLSLENGGIGPAIIKSLTVSVDGTPRKDWGDVLRVLSGKAPEAYTHMTAVDHALRAGDRSTLLGLQPSDMPPHFWEAIARVGVTVCYASVFGESESLVIPHLGKAGTWHAVDTCPKQPAGVEF